MKTLILLTLTVIAAQAAVIDPVEPISIELYDPDVAEIEAEAPETRSLARNNINVGIVAGSTVFRRITVGRNGVINQIITADFTARPTNGRRISAVQAFIVGGNQGATARIISGGIGHSFVTIRIQTARGRGYHYQLNFFAR